MKKAFIAILAFLYLAVASGIEMNIHYCMGEVASVELGSATGGTCAKCGMESKKGCCEDESKIVKLDDSHQLSQLAWSILAPAIVSIQPGYQLAAINISSPVTYARSANGPPPGPGLPLYITNCVYRI